MSATQDPFQFSPHSTPLPAIGSDPIEASAHHKASTTTMIATHPAETFKPGVADEVMILRNRVEQQSDLIMMLKNRNDDLQGELTSTREQLTASGKEVAKATAAKTKASRSLDLINSRFGQLADQHEKMIVIKDEHKTDKKKYKLQCDELTEELKTIVGRLEAKSKSRIKTLEAAEMAARLEVERLRGLLQVQTKESTDSVEAATKRADGVQEDSDRFQRERDRLRDQLDSISAGTSKQLDQLKKSSAVAKADLEATTKKLQMTEGRLGAAEVEGHAAKAKVVDLEARLAKETASALVGEAQEQLEAALHQIKSVKQEYGAYKKYSADVLKKEREMNQRLRHLHAST